MKVPHTSSSSMPMEKPKFADIDRHAMLSTLGVQVDASAPGHVALSLARDDRFTQQNGFLHAGVIATIADCACGYAALTLFPEDRDGLTAHFTLDLLRPAVHDRFVAMGSVVRSGRRLSVCTAEVNGVDHEGSISCVAIMQATIAAVGGSE